jgi:hypothetical protein
VEIYYFQAKFRDEVVILEWETGPEVDMLGFFVTRSNAQYGGYARISNLIPNKGDESAGAYYNFTDPLISNDTPYWYRLEAVETGNRVTYSSLVYIVTGSVRSPTATTTLVSTPTSSPTATGFFAALNPTSTASPTATRVPGTITATPPVPASFTPTVAPIPEATATLSSTLTLVPLPEITLQFPTPITNLDISAEGSAKAQGISPDQQRRNILLAIGRVIFLGFIALIWLILAVWFYLASRRVE